MKAITVKRTSLLFKLAEFGGLDDRYDTSICDLNARIMMGAGRILAIIVISLFFGFFMASPVYYGVLYFIDHANGFFDIKREVLLIGLIVDTVAFLTTCLIFYMKSDYYNYNKLRDDYVCEPCQLSLHWAAFKEKVCIKVDYK